MEFYHVYRITVITPNLQQQPLMLVPLHRSHTVVELMQETRVALNLLKWFPPLPSDARFEVHLGTEDGPILNELYTLHDMIPQSMSTMLFAFLQFPSDIPSHYQAAQSAPNDSNNLQAHKVVGADPGTKGKRGRVASVSASKDNSDTEARPVADRDQPTRKKKRGPRYESRPMDASNFTQEMVADVSYHLVSLRCFPHSVSTNRRKDIQNSAKIWTRKTKENGRECVEVRSPQYLLAPSPANVAISTARS